MKKKREQKRGREQTPEKRQVNAVLPVELHRAIRVLAAERGVHASAVIAEALVLYLDSRPPRGAAA